MKPSGRHPLYRILLGLLLITLMPSLHAVSLGLDENTFPNFTVDFDTTGQISFNKDTGLLSISGSAQSYKEVLGGEQHPVFASTFILTANLTGINCPGPGCVSGGSNFTIDGDVRDVNTPAILYYDGSTNVNGLLSGDLTNFGWSSTGISTGKVGEIEFTFNNASGVIAEGALLLGGGGPYLSGGMVLNIINSGSPLAFDFETEIFTNSWTLDGSGQVFVPIPAAVWLFGSGLFALIGLGRKRNKN